MRRMRTALAGTALVIGVAAMLVVPVSARPVQDDGSVAARMVRLAIDFKGGPVAAYVDSIRRQVPDVNILLMPEASHVPVPPMRLRDVSIDSAIALLDPLSARTATELVQVGTNTERRGGSPVYVIRGTVKSFSPPAQTKVMAVGHILAADVEPEAMLTAIETALGLFGPDYEPAELRFHEATGLIITRGHPSQIAVIDDVIDELYANVKTREQHRLKEKAMAEAQQRVAALEDALRQSASQVDVLEAQSLEYERHIAALSQKVQNAELAADRREAEIAQLTTRIRTLEK